MVKKPPGTLPIRKHKLSSTPGTGQAITKFFDRKEEQARHQQQLSKIRPAGPPPTFSAPTTGSRAPVSAASASATAASNAAPSGSTSAGVHVTSAASSLADTAEPGRLPKPADPKARPVSENQLGAAQPREPDQLAAASSEPHVYTVDALPVSSSVVGVRRPRQKASGQTSLEYMMMSQDDDGCRIKWQASPQHHSLTPSQADAASRSVPNQDLTAMKLRLANAVQKSAGSSTESSKRSQSSEGRDSLLDDLLALPPPQHSRLQKVTSLDRIGSKALSPSNPSSSLGKSGTPGSGSGSALKTPRLDAGSADVPRKQVTFRTDSEAGMQFSPAAAMSGSVLKKRPRRLQKANENSGTGGKRSAVRKRKALIELLDQVELLVQSRNVRERLDGEEPLQAIPERPSQETLLSQQEDMLQEMQTSQDTGQGLATQPHQLPAPPGPVPSSSQEDSVESNKKTEQRSSGASPESSRGCGAVATDKMDSCHGNAGSQDAAVSMSNAAATIRQHSDHGQHLSQAVQLPDESRQLDPAAPAQQLSTTVSVQQYACGTQDAAAAAAPCLNTGASGVLAIDDSDDLEFELAQQMEDAAKTARSTQHAQQAAHDAGSKSKGSTPSAPVQLEQPTPQQDSDKLAVQPTTHMPNAAEPKTHQADPAGANAPIAAGANEASAAVHPANAHFTAFNSSNAFQDNDMEIDDHLAQLLDAATALRPAGPPDTALAGPGPASTSSFHHKPRSNSPRSRPDSPATSHQAPPTCNTQLPGQAGKPLDAPTQANEVLPKGRTKLGSTTAGARECDDAMLAPEPAGPADLTDQRALPQLLGDRVHVHYTVKDVQVSPHEKILHLEGSYTQEQVVVHLHNGWHDTPVEPGHSVNLIAEKTMGSDGLLHATCDFNAGMVILHPDMLLSGTRISGSLRCQRQSVLEERFAGSSNDKAVEGTLMHEVFQAALTKRITNRASLEEVARRCIANSTDKLFEVGLDEHKAMARLHEAIPRMLSWVQRFLRPMPAKNATVTVRPGEGVAGGNLRPMCVRQVVDIEENVWAPKYGLKGMIDASLTASFLTEEDVPIHKGWLQKAAQPQKPAAAATQDVMIPFEFKTGKPFNGHNAQVALYLLLMQERYGQVIESGLLWYLSHSNPQQVKLVPQELLSLMQTRNWLAAALMPAQPLPAVIRDEWACDKCFQKSVCALSHKALENGNEASSGLGPAYSELTGHLSEASTHFFQHWLTLVELEEAPLQGKRAEIWKMTGESREKSGRCITNLVLTPAAPPEASAGVLLGQVARSKLLYTALRAPPSDEQQSGRKAREGLNEKGFAEADMAVLSIEGQQACVCRPTIASIFANAITLAVDKPLRGAMLDPAVRWRIDKDEVSSIFTRMRCNLMDVMDPAREHVQRSRRLIADLEAPAQPQLQSPSRARDPNSGLNEDQELAVDRVLGASDYTLILGMPGTGKTSTIVQAIKGLVAQGKSVLLTSYTNSAVDNVLLKLVQEGVQFLRLGRAESVHPLLQGWAVGGEHHPNTSVKGLTQMSETSQVVACTALGVNHCLLKGRVFDMCIVDEAGQMTLPVALGPILHSKAFTLVGDHYQLPPLVTSKAAEEGGLGVSLFKRLCDHHPQMVVPLRAQYRMAADIMLLANTIVYDGQLRCGAHHVAEAVLDLQVAPSQIGLPQWLTQVLAPQQRVLFLDTDSMPAPEVRTGDTLSNPREAAIMTDIVRGLDLGQVPLQDIGIISPYRAQVLLMSRICKEKSWSQVEVLTVDKCQGRDKDVILLSLVRSNGECNAGNLLRDWRRLNVAITRAKKKLLLVGSQTTLRTIPHFHDLLTLLTQKQWLLPLPMAGIVPTQL